MDITLSRKDLFQVFLHEKKIVFPILVALFPLITVIFAYVCRATLPDDGLT